MEAVDTSTGEVVELDPRHLTEQQRLFGEFAAVEVYSLAITGASDLEGDEDLELGQDVTIVVRGRVQKVAQEVKWDKDYSREVLVRRATIKAAGGRVTKRGA